MHKPSTCQADICPLPAMCVARRHAAAAPHTHCVPAHVRAHTWAWAVLGMQIRSSSGMREEVCLPPDFERLLEANAPDMELHEFAREMQTLDVLLWHYVAAVDEQGASGGALSAAGSSCGYVSAVGAGSSAAAAAGG